MTWHIWLCPGNLHKDTAGGVPWWLSGLRISVITAVAHCCCCGVDSIPEPETSACHGCGKKKKKKKKDPFYLFFLSFFLGGGRPMAYGVPRPGTETTWSCDPHHSYGTTRSLTHCARPGINLVPATAETVLIPIVTQWELLCFIKKEIQLERV